MKLKLYPGAVSCNHCGYCCTVCPCPYGTWDRELKQCRELEWQTDGTSRCKRYAEIVARPEQEWATSPAFGAGCCSPLNTRRLELLQRP